MSKAKDSDASKAQKPKPKTFCTYWPGNELQQVQTIAKAKGISTNKMIREIVLKKLSIKPSE